MKEINKTWKYTDIFFFSKLQEVCQGLKWYGAPLLLWLNLLLVSQLILSHTSLLDVLKKKKTPVYSCLRTLSSTFAPHPSARLIYSLIYFLSVFEYCPVVRPFLKQMNIIKLAGTWSESHRRSQPFEITVASPRTSGKMVVIGQHKFRTFWNLLP